MKKKCAPCLNRPQWLCGKWLHTTAACWTRWKKSKNANRLANGRMCARPPSLWVLVHDPSVASKPHILTWHHQDLCHLTSSQNVFFCFFFNLGRPDRVCPGGGWSERLSASVLTNFLFLLDSAWLCLLYQKLKRQSKKCKKKNLKQVNDRGWKVRRGKEMFSKRLKHLKWVWSFRLGQPALD